jgi:hypothetical protein
MPSHPDRNASASEPTVAPGCCHHWVIQAATGPVSQGECQKCHQTRYFENFVERPEWGSRQDGTLPGSPPLVEFAEPYL